MASRPLATPPPDTEETTRTCPRTPAEAKNRSTPSPLSVARNPPPERATAKAGSGPGGRSGSRRAHVWAQGPAMPLTVTPARRGEIPTGSLLAPPLPFVTSSSWSWPRRSRRNGKNVGVRQGGVVTLLFTDLVGSTELLAHLGDDDAEALRRTHFRLLRQAVTAHGGEEVKNLGDGLMVAFPSAVGALQCAVAMQQAVARHNRSADQPLAVRAGLHVGEPILDEADYFGTSVVVAKRLCDQAEGGQILASDLVRALVGTRGGFRFKDVGPLALKGLAEPTGACEVLWEPLAAAAPSLPAALAGDEPFVGRQPELRELEGAWKRVADGYRQVVLVAGEPGIGKTSLARQLAHRAQGTGTVLYGRCDEEALTPYQPFVEALTHYLERQGRGQIEARLGRVLDDVGVLLPGVGG